MVAFFVVSAPSQMRTRSAVLNIEPVRRAWWLRSFQSLWLTHAWAAHMYRGLVGSLSWRRASWRVLGTLRGPSGVSILCCISWYSQAYEIHS
jgi:hypothetical protein